MAYNNYFPMGYQPMQYYPQMGQPQQPQQQYQQNQPMQMGQQQQMNQMNQMNQQNAQVQQPMNNSIIWVQGEAGAKSYLVAPNTTVQLWDSENQTIYLKSADASGMPSMKILDYTIRDMQQNSVNLAQNSPNLEFATRDEVNVLSERIEALRGDFEGFTKRTAGRQKKEAVDNE